MFRRGGWPKWPNGKYAYNQAEQILGSKGQAKPHSRKVQKSVPFVSTDLHLQSEQFPCSCAMSTH